jgi:hypothetical protein
MVDQRMLVKVMLSGLLLYLLTFGIDFYQCSACLCLF